MADFKREFKVIGECDVPTILTRALCNENAFYADIGQWERQHLLTRHNMHVAALHTVFHSDELKKELWKMSAHFATWSL